MGLFGKKEKIPESIRVIYYEGELQEFPCNYPCQLLLMDNALQITKIKPYVEVNLGRERILGIDIMPETQYMAKYKGNAMSTSKGGGEKTYYVIRYMNKVNEPAHLDFWGSFSETLKIEKMKKTLFENQQPKSYEI